MKYDKAQLSKDLKAISSMKGFRKQVGFFMVSVYVDEKIRIVNEYITDAKLFVNDQLVSLDDVFTESELGQHILHLIVKMEDQMKVMKHEV